MRIKIGIDAGSTTAKVVAIADDGSLLYGQKDERTSDNG